LATFAALICLFSTEIFSQTINPADSVVLVKIFNETGGTAWSNPWKFTERASRWAGVSINAAGKVVSLSLASQNLRGNLPSQVYLLSGLTHLNLAGNPYLNANLNVVRQMTQLQNLYISSMNLRTSEIPSLASLSSLKVLDLTGNQLTTMPSFLAAMPNLKELYMSGNKITSIPDFIGGLTSLEILHLQNNALTGDFPTTMANLLQMRELRAENNKLTGALSLSMRNWLRLETLVLTNNKISDTLTVKIGDMVNLKCLQIGNNSFFYEIPSSLGNLRKLVVADFSNNRFDGEIPQTIGEITSLTYLDISKNRLTLGLPASFADLVNLSYFNCANNELGGSLPHNLGNVKNISHLDISHNKFNGNFPASVAGLAKLTYFDMSDNDFFYDNLQLITTFSALQYLNVSNNRIARPIPNDIGKLENLTYFNFSDNYIPGALPASVGKLKKLQRLIGTKNRISGAVPKEINGAFSLYEIDLSFNEIVDFPKIDKDSIKSLAYLRLNNNYLTFEDLEPNLRIASAFIYSPQAKTVLEQPCLLKANVGGQYNRYKWFFNGTKDDCDCNDKDNTHWATKAGHYTCEIRNDSVPGLTIFSEAASINTNQTAPEVNLGSDTVFCQYPFLLRLDAGKGARSYLWSNGDTSRFLNVTTPGKYIVEVKKNVCTVYDTVNVFYAGAQNNQIGPEQVICKGEAPKIIIGGASSAWHRYVWQTSEDMRTWKKVAETKDYTPPKDELSVRYFRRLVLSDTCGEQSSNIVAVRISDISLENVFKADVSCPGQSDGIINLKIKGGVAPVKIFSSISPDSTQTNFKDIPAGTYTFTIRDGIGCEINLSIAVKQPEPIELSYAIVQASCKTDKSDGKINLFVKGGTAPYHFDWNEGEFLTQNLSGLAPDENKIYRVKVTDFRGCEAYLETKMTRQPVFETELSYPNEQYCTTEANPKPTVNRSYGYFLSESEGIALDRETGEINLSASKSGIYDIVYFYDDCSADTFRLEITANCIENLPNTITPNGDGVNDVWDSPVFERFSEMVVQIFDRSGKLIFESERGYPHKWNATFEGYPLPQDTYYYVIEFHDGKATAKKHNGFISVIRED
jgi:gliding motility-associated-like protein